MTSTRCSTNTPPASATSRTSTWSWEGSPARTTPWRVPSRSPRASRARRACSGGTSTGSSSSRNPATPSSRTSTAYSRAPPVSAGATSRSSSPAWRPWGTALSGAWSTARSTARPSAAPVPRAQETPLRHLRERRPPTQEPRPSARARLRDHPLLPGGRGVPR